MELTKKDKKHIEEQVRKLYFKLKEDAMEYARLYQREYYEAVIEKCKEQIDVLDALHEVSLKLSETSHESNS